MKLRWFGLLVAACSFFLTMSGVSAAPCSMLVTSCSSPNGTNANIVFNTMPFSRPLYIYNSNTCLDDASLMDRTDIPTSMINSTTDCLLFRGQSMNGTTNNLPDTACVSPLGQYGCPCFEDQCVIDKASNENLITENNFTSVRKCNGTSCDTRDPLGYFPGHANYETLPTYNHGVTGTIALGDKIRVMVYSHDNAKEQFPEDAHYNDYMAKNVKSKITWSDNSIIGSISATNATSKTAPAITIPSLPEGTHFEAVGAWHHYNNGSTKENFEFIATYNVPTDSALTTTSNSAEFNIGDHASCFGNIHRVYFDLVVKENQAPNFTLVKTASPTTTSDINPGQSITYSLTLSNTGTTILSDITAEDKLDSKLTFVSSDPGVSHYAGDVTITFPTLPLGASATKTFVAKVKADTAAPTQICNTASATGHGITVSSKEICHNISPNLVTDFEIIKSAVPNHGSDLYPGNTVSFTITVKNTGTANIPTLNIADTLNTNFEFLNGDTNVSHANGVISATITNLAAEESSSITFTVKLKDDAQDSINICNQAAATTGTLTKASNKVCHNLVAPMDFDLQKTALDLNGNVIPAGTILVPGTKFDYKITLVRTGGGATLPINYIDVKDSLPGALNFISNLSDNDISNIGEQVQINFPIPVIGSFGEKTFRVQVSPTTSDDDFCNTAEAYRLSADLDIVGESILSNTLCHGINKKGGDIHLTKRAFDLEEKEIPTGTVLAPGTEFNFNITLTQDLPSIASVTKNLLASIVSSDPTPVTTLSNLDVTDVLDNSNLEFVHNNGDLTISHSNGKVTLEFLAPSPNKPQSKTFVVRVKPNATDNKFCNEAATSWEGNIITSNKVCYGITGINGDVELHKTASIPEGTTLTPGQAFEYQISLVNNSNTIQTVKIYDPLDENIIFDTTNTGNSTLNYDTATHTVALDFLLIAPGATSSQTIYVTTSPNITEETIVCNSASNEITTTTEIIQDTETEEEVTSNDIIESWPTTKPIEPGKSVGEQIIDTLKKIGKWLTGAVINPFTVENLGGDTYTTTSPLISEEVCHTVTTATTPHVTSLEKSVSTGAGTIANSALLTYTIKYTSAETDTVTTTFWDMLDTNYIWMGNQSITTSDDTVITGTITHDGAATGGLVTLEAADIPTSGWIEYKFDVVVGDGTLPTEICNQAYAADSSLFSNIVCSPTTTTTTTTGGGGIVVSTIGICADAGNGTPTCRKHYPHKSQGEQEYKDWKACKKLNPTNQGIEDCTRNWADAVGLLAIGECHPDTYTSSQTTGGWREDFDTNGYVWMGGKPGDHEDDCQVQIIPNECNSVSVCEEINATIAKSTSTPSIAKDEMAKYKVDVNLENENTDPNSTVWITGIKIYDLTIPTDSGWVWDHVMKSDNADWIWKGEAEKPSSNYFEWDGGEFELLGTMPFSLDYSMNTELTIAKDTAHISNVAFAVVEYSVISVDEDGVESITPGNFYLGGDTDPEAICKNKFVSEIIGSSSSLGSSATVTIVRPFVEVRGGGNIGVEKLTENSEKPFGGLNTNSSYEDRISSGEVITGDQATELTETGDFLENSDLKSDAIGTEKVLGVIWDTTLDDSGVYFYADDLTLSGDSSEVFTGSKTFVIDGKLTIEKDFNPGGFGAFIANDILINSTVTSLTGIFIADDGEITTDTKSDKQLVISGALMGDATNLLANRNYIGDTSIADPDEMILEPSIKINYDMRLLDATPPALELFLSEDWTQTAE